ncbi:hypothetical protein J8273_1113 [Carpediemonas membranifera]|uniref:Uncharacterized protein n=1 Tax=Carpediemonas membranifera TaxID=201153 RepID=A0A8J6B9W4_9EUKA|nr:hypothetical protein J8273_1113 [Carpediemonas membranifera]|eukprot:KAG9397204.1 hypothetical protein J8273_1113 [Carpediemonas membranifera]
MVEEEYEVLIRSITSPDTVSQDTEKAIRTVRTLTDDFYDQFIYYFSDLVVLGDEEYEEDFLKEALYALAITARYSGDLADDALAPLREAVRKIILNEAEQEAKALEAQTTKTKKKGKRGKKRGESDTENEDDDNIDRLRPYCVKVLALLAHLDHGSIYASVPSLFTPLASLYELHDARLRATVGVAISSLLTARVYPVSIREMVDPVIELLEDENADVRIAMLEGTARLLSDNSSDLDPLRDGWIERLKDADRKVRSECVRAVRRPLSHALEHHGLTPGSFQENAVNALGIAITTDDMIAAEALLDLIWVRDPSKKIDNQKTADASARRMCEMTLLASRNPNHSKVLFKAVQMMWKRRRLVQDIISTQDQLVALSEPKTRALGEDNDKGHSKEIKELELRLPKLYKALCLSGPAIAVLRRPGSTNLVHRSTSSTGMTVGAIVRDCLNLDAMLTPRSLEFLLTGKDGPLNDCVGSDVRDELVRFIKSLHLTPLKTMVTKHVWEAVAELARSTPTAEIKLLTAALASIYSKPDQATRKVPNVYFYIKANISPILDAAADAHNNGDFQLASAFITLLQGIENIENTVSLTDTAKESLKALFIDSPVFGDEDIAAICSTASVAGVVLEKLNNQETRAELIGNLSTMFADAVDALIKKRSATAKSTATETAGELTRRVAVVLAGLAPCSKSTIVLHDCVKLVLSVPLVEELEGYTSYVDFAKDDSDSDSEESPAREPEYAPLVHPSGARRCSSATLAVVFAMECMTQWLSPSRFVPSPLDGKDRTDEDTAKTTMATVFHFLRKLLLSNGVIQGPTPAARTATAEQTLSYHGTWTCLAAADVLMKCIWTTRTLRMLEEISKDGQRLEKPGKDRESTADEVTAWCRSTDIRFPTILQLLANLTQHLNPHARLFLLKRLAQAIVDSRFNIVAIALLCFYGADPDRAMKLQAMRMARHAVEKAFLITQGGRDIVLHGPEGLAYWLTHILTNVVGAINENSADMSNAHNIILSIAVFACDCLLHAAADPTDITHRSLAFLNLIKKRLSLHPVIIRDKKTGEFDPAMYATLNRTMLVVCDTLIKVFSEKAKKMNLTINAVAPYDPKDCAYGWYIPISDDSWTNRKNDPLLPRDHSYLLKTIDDSDSLAFLTPSRQRRTPQRTTTQRRTPQRATTQRRTPKTAKKTPAQKRKTPVSKSRMSPQEMSVSPSTRVLRKRDPRMRLDLKDAFDSSSESEGTASM